MAANPIKKLTRTLRARRIDYITRVTALIFGAVACQLVARKLTTMAKELGEEHDKDKISKLTQDILDRRKQQGH